MECDPARSLILSVALEMARLVSYVHANFSKMDAMNLSSTVCRLLGPKCRG